MDYYVFVLGYDLLHEDLDGIECDVAYRICTRVMLDFAKSVADTWYPRSTYEQLSGYVTAHRDEIKSLIEESR